VRAVAAVAAGALLLAGCGGTTKHVAPHGPAVALNLKGGTPVRIAACGAGHHYTRYPRGASVEFAGTVTPVPRGRWKVKVKIKSCRSGAFETVTKIRAARDKKTGGFSGRLPRLPAGAYYARAQLYVNGTQLAQSDKRHFTTG
jgi:hypothetical protein